MRKVARDSCVQLRDHRRHGLAGVAGQVRKNEGLGGIHGRRCAVASFGEDALLEKHYVSKRSRRQIATHKRFNRLVDEWIDLSIEHSRMTMQIAGPGATR
jgi:hypothetical protein